jgi:hypothetical protein
LGIEFRYNSGAEFNAVVFFTISEEKMQNIFLTVLMSGNLSTPVTRLRAI